MSGIGRKAIPSVRKWSEDPPYVRVKLGGPPGCPGVVGTTSQISGSGREAFPEVREWSGGPRNVREWLGDPFVCP